MERRTPPSESRNFQAPKGETPVVLQPQAKSGEFVLPTRSAREYQSQQDHTASPRRRGGQEKPLEHAPTGELYRGSLIRKLRNDKGLKIQEVEDQVGYARGSLTTIETNYGFLSQEKLHKLAELLEVPAAVLAQAPQHPRTLSRKGANGVVH